MLNKTFDPKDFEDKHYKRMEKSGAFAANPDSDAEPFTIMMPPPNVTGSLHMGHALNTTMQDILTRYYRMNGRDVLWQPGTDHASIAVHMVLENQLAEQGKTRDDLTRDEFMDMAWAWKEKSGSTIVNQMKKLGASPDWDRERFTLDEGLNKAVNHAFVRLFKEGIIKRQKRLVNWDPKRQTVISDIEVNQKEQKGKMWHIRYPVADSGVAEEIIVATTRPETLLGDTAVAVHPDDDRYQHLIGKMVTLPLCDRLIPIIADKHADPEHGSGAVKITPAHDFNDFAVGQRHNLPMINIFDEKAYLNDNAPEAYQGMERFAARKQVLKDLEDIDAIVKVDTIKHAIPYGERSGVIVEPYLTDQWFCDAEILAKPALEAVRKGDMQFVPKNWENTYYQWLENIQPWCISRQLWWGHQIPAWYDEDGAVYVAETEEDAYAQAEDGAKLTRDEDVLDTWFSSALWPFSTIGWPEKTPELNKYYPGNVLITGFDIIFFWVARMMMMGLYFMDEAPFKDVYMHALVRAEDGQKMSKSKGNVMNPLDLIDQYGTDALRFTLSAMAAQGRDIRLSQDRINGYRNFCTKLWNASRYCEMHECKPLDGFDMNAVKHPLNQWILGELSATKTKIDDAVNEYKFNDIADTLYQFTWGTFCDWYLEFTKPFLTNEDAPENKEIRAVTGYVLQQIYVLLNPVMPFVTEELHQNLTGSDDLIMAGSWPDYSAFKPNKTAAADIDWIIDAISKIRSVRADMNVPNKAETDLIIKDADDALQSRIATYTDIIKRMATLQNISYSDDTPKGAVQIVMDKTTLMLPVTELIDLDAERARLQKQIEKLDKDIAIDDKKLSNENFVKNAPQDVITEHRERKALAENQRKKIQNALQQLAC